MVAAIKTISLNSAFSSPSSLSFSLSRSELFPRCRSKCFLSLIQFVDITTDDDPGVNDPPARGFPRNAPTRRHIDGSSIRLLDAFVAIHALKLQFGSWIALMRTTCHIPLSHSCCFSRELRSAKCNDRDERAANNSMTKTNASEIFPVDFRYRLPQIQGIRKNILRQCIVARSQRIDTAVSSAWQYCKING